MSPYTAVSRKGGWALFLDVDGTLLELAETPQAVHVPESLKQLLSDLSLRLEGALALVSGRSLENLDRLFAPLRLSASGVHGCERREAGGRTIRPPIDAARMADARERLAAFVRDHEGLLLEDKHYSLAVHFRRAPHLSADVHSALQDVLEHLGPDFGLQAGKCVYELRLATWNKGSSISAFMQEPPFRGRTPVYIGDDVTDEDAFGAVNTLNGISIRVGAAEATQAQHTLTSVAEVHRWLKTIPPVIAPPRAG